MDGPSSAGRNASEQDDDSIHLEEPSPEVENPADEALGDR
jgi:hypothetical protein